MGVRMGLMMGPDGQPATYDGTAWVSRDGRYWWNGAAWMPARAIGWRPSLGQVFIVFAVLLGLFVVWRFVLPNFFPPDVQYGVTNTKIDSPTQVEFDYIRATSCNELTFRAVFYDNADNQVQLFDDSTINSVPSNQLVHFTLKITPPIPASVVRFDAVPACLG
jgi:hypothetical protein